MLMKFQPVEEQKRTYIFPSGEVSFDDVTSICVRPSGTHRLNTADRRKVIVPNGWLAIVIESKAPWLF